MRAVVLVIVLLAIPGCTRTPNRPTDPRVLEEKLKQALPSGHQEFNLSGFSDREFRYTLFYPTGNKKYGSVFQVDVNHHYLGRDWDRGVSTTVTCHLLVGSNVLRMEWDAKGNIVDRSKPPGDETMMRVMEDKARAIYAATKKVLGG